MDEQNKYGEIPKAKMKYDNDTGLVPPEYCNNNTKPPIMKEDTDVDIRFWTILLTMAILIGFTWFIEWNHPGNWSKNKRIIIIVLPFAVDLVTHTIIPFLKKKKDKDNAN